MQDYQTFDQQIEILKKRGLVIDNEEEVREILSIHNYYNVINGYKDLFCYIDTSGKEKFISGTSFDEVYALYCFDRELRSLIFMYTLQIENTLRALVWTWQEQLSKKIISIIML